MDHDVHVHTALSACCKDPQAVPEKLIARAALVGLKTLGFADHLWDAAIDGASDWYRPQDVEHVLSIRRRIPADTGGVRVLVGCETEYCGGGRVGISLEAARRFDYVLVPASHFHMKGFVVPSRWMGRARIAALLAERFNEAVDLEVATGIAHPFLPLGHPRDTGRILAHLSDAQLEDCFGRAAQRGVSIEVHPGMFPSLGRGERRGFCDEAFLRLLRIARQAGCVFHFASDAHRLDEIGSVHRLAPLAAQAGITAGDVHPLFRSAGAEPAPTGPSR